MIVPGTPQLNAVQSETVRGTQPARFPRYRTFRIPKPKMPGLALRPEEELPRLRGGKAALR